MNEVVGDNFFEDEDEGNDLGIDASLLEDREAENFRRYRQGERGQRATKKYNDSPAAREARKRYAQSPKGKEATRRHRETDIFKVGEEKRKEKQIRVKQMMQWESLGLCGLCGAGEHRMDFHVSPNGVSDVV